jgi:choline dehydrogenase
MVFIRGQASDFDEWRDRGNPGWGWNDVLPTFRKLEDFSGGASAWRGSGGPIHVADVGREYHPLCRNFLDACVEAGLTETADFNGERSEGVGLYQITARRGLRMSAARGYLWPALKRSNLRLELKAHATRVTFEGRRAVGVSYTIGGETRTAQARREVILAAGAVASPLLLQRSGVGPAALLQRHGIAVVHASEGVGWNLQDHLCIDHLYRVKVPSLNGVLGTWHGRIGIGLQYLVSRRGPLSIGVNQAGGFIRSHPEAPRPDLQLYFSPVSYTKPSPGKRALLKPDPFPGVLMGAQPCRPTSRGHLEIRSADPFAPPVIHPNSLANETDIREILAGSKLLRRLAQMPAMASVISEELKPGPATRSDDELLADIRARAGTVFHPVGTCQMGPDARESVVDPSLKVHGLDGLRVIDASIFPTLTSGNTNAPTLMVAEKGAEFVLRDAG